MPRTRLRVGRRPEKSRPNASAESRLGDLIEEASLSLEEAQTDCANAPPNDPSFDLMPLAQHQRNDRSFWGCAVDA